LRLEFDKDGDDAGVGDDDNDGDEGVRTKLGDAWWARYFALFT
jgi:hypothetical protein